MLSQALTWLCERPRGYFTEEAVPSARPAPPSLKGRGLGLDSKLMPVIAFGLRVGRVNGGEVSPVH